MITGILKSQMYLTIDESALSEHRFRMILGLKKKKWKRKNFPENYVIQVTESDHYTNPLPRCPTTGQLLPLKSIFATLLMWTEIEQKHFHFEDKSNNR